MFWSNLGLAVHAEHPNETTLRCLGIRMEFEQIYNTNPQLAHMVMQNPKVKEAQKFLQEAVKEMEQDSPEKKSK